MEIKSTAPFRSAVRTAGTIGLGIFALLSLLGAIVFFTLASNKTNQADAENFTKLAIALSIFFGITVVGVLVIISHSFYKAWRSSNKPADKISMVYKTNPWSEAANRVKPASTEEMHGFIDDGKGDQGTYKDGEYFPYDPSQEWDKQ